MMTDLGSKAQTFFLEMQRRRVFRVAMVYAAVAFIIFQVIDATFEYLPIPAWVGTAIIVVLMAGFPIAVGLAWAFDVTPEGLIRTPSRESLLEAVAKTRRPTRPLTSNLVLVAIALMAVTAAIWSWRSGVSSEPAPITLKSIAVLPFTNVGGDPINQAFCDGLTETLTSKLSQLEQFQGSLLVVDASEPRGQRIASPSEAHLGLGVNLAVTGSAQLFPNSRRLTLNLVDATTQRLLNSSVIDAHISNVTALQDSLVIIMAEMLEVQLQPPTRRLLAAGRTSVPAAYDSYLQGRGYLQRFERRENLISAIGSFKRALALDSLYALAYAGLGEAYWRRYKVSGDAQWVEPAVKNCEHAVELNDLLAPVHVTLGMIHTGTGRYEEGIQELQRALALDPQSAAAYRELAKAYEAQGRLRRAEATYQKAIELKPEYWAAYNNLGVFYFKQGRYEEAVKQFHLVVTLTPRNIRGYTNLGAAYLILERPAEALEIFEHSLEIEPNYRAYTNLGSLYFYHEGRYADAARMYEQALALEEHDYRVSGNLASAYYWAPGERSKARAAYQRAAQLAEEQRNVNARDPALIIHLAGYYGMLGEPARALALVEQALTLAPNAGDVMFSAADIYEHLGQRGPALEWIGKALELGYSPVQLEHSPGLQQLRADARFQRLLERSGDKR